MPNGVSTPSAMPPPRSTACCVTGAALAAWQQARWLSRLPDSSSGHNDEAWPHGASPRPPRALNMHVDVPIYLGTSQRLRRAGWAATKAAQSRSTSPAAAPDPTMCHTL